MILLRNRLTSKLFIFVFVVSFFLIGGSYTLFYFIGKEFLQNSVNKELSIFNNLFQTSLVNLISQYNTEVDAFILENKTALEDNSINHEIIQKLIERNFKKYEELYLSSEGKGISKLFVPEKIFTGEYYLNQIDIDSLNYNKILEEIEFPKSIKENEKFDIGLKNSSKEIFIKKSRDYFSILLRLNMNYFFETLFFNIQLPTEINISLVDSSNIIFYSTNTIWNNQKLIKFIDQENLSSKYSKIENYDILFGKWDCEFLNCNVIITKDYSNEFDQFKSIFTYLLLYSGIVYVLIVLLAFVYSNKLSKSLTEVTNVIGLVSSGNFNEKINIKRNDELGLLINAFNNMIVDLKSSYEKLNFTNRELEEKINELVETKAELTKKEKLALVGETISKISHEIQNKISGVSVWVQNLELQTNLNENTKIYVDEIKNSLNSFLKMLLDFKKYYGQPFLEKAHFSFNELLSNVINGYQIDIKSKHIIIKNNCDNSDFQLHADKNLIEEVIVNLLVNAIYFCPPNGIITIDCKYKSDEFIFSISNNGPLIESKNLGNLFNPFFTTKSSGSGLGLAICKNIIEAHKGDIKVNNLDSGVVFIITLPNFKD